MTRRMYASASALSAISSQRGNVRASAVCTRSWASTGSGTSRRALRSSDSCRERTYSSKSSGVPLSLVAGLTVMAAASVPCRFAVRERTRVNAVRGRQGADVMDGRQRLLRNDRPAAHSRFTATRRLCNNARPRRGTRRRSGGTRVLSGHRQPVLAPREGFDEAVGDQAVECPFPLYGLVPDGFQRGAFHRALGVAQHRQQPAAHLPVGAGVGLAAARRAVVRGPPDSRQAQRAATGQRSHPGERAVHTSAPSSMVAAAHLAAVGSSRGSSCAASRRSAAVVAFGGYWSPLTTRANTRRTLVSITACRCP